MKWFGSLSGLALVLVPFVVMMLTCFVVPVAVSVRSGWCGRTVALALVAVTAFLASVVVSVRRAEESAEGFSDGPLGEAPALVLVAAVAGVFTLRLSRRRLG